MLIKISKFLIVLVSIFEFTTSLAQSSLSGQFGCVVNKNFAGATVQYETGTGITGSNYMMYLDFTNLAVQFSVVGWTNWGSTGLAQASGIVTNGSLSVSTGPITNSYLVSGNLSGNSVSFYMMMVNNGNTLLVQSGYPNSGNGEPLTGVCQKI